MPNRHRHPSSGSAAGVFALLVATASLPGCVQAPVASPDTAATATTPPVVTPPPAPPPLPSTAASAPPSSQLLRSWRFDAPDADEGGWTRAWNSSEDNVITSAWVEPGVGLQVSLVFANRAWGDANLRLGWGEAVAPTHVLLRLLVPAEAGRIKGPLMVGCAFNNPWSEEKHWSEVRPTERVTVLGKAYNAEDLTCRLGNTTRQHQDVVLRFGGERVRYKGAVYVQRMSLVRQP